MKVLTNQEFKERAEKKHGKRYDYSEVNYINAITKIDIICPEHGSFPQTPNSHLNGSGCPKCAGKDKTTAELIVEFNKIHNNKYDYSLVIYSSAKEKVKIICPKHGLFPQTPDKHLRGQGCPKCKLDNLRSYFISNEEEFIEKANIKHNYKYDYSNVSYKNSLTKVEIICPEHGPFPQTPGDHLSGYGCPRCTHYVSKPEIAWLDSLGIPNDPEHRQVRIKTATIFYKVDGFDPETKTCYELNGDYYHGNPAKFLPDDINPTNKKTYGELYQKTLAKKAALEEAGYKVISIWESDFKRQIKN